MHETISNQPYQGFDGSKGALKELAFKCGVFEMTVRRILSAKHNPTTYTEEKIAEVIM